MAKEEKTIYVYDHFTGNAPVLLGKLNVGIIKGGEAYSFEGSSSIIRFDSWDYTKTIV